jgi:hypothetical protein
VEPGDGLLEGLAGLRALLRRDALTPVRLVAEAVASRACGGERPPAPGSAGATAPLTAARVRGPPPFPCPWVALT